MLAGRLPFVLALAAALVTAGPAAARPLVEVDRATLQVDLETRIVEVRKGFLRDAGLEPGLFRTRLTCPSGTVAVSPGFMPDAFGVSVRSSFPVGTRSWEFTDANFTEKVVDVFHSLECARILDGPKLTVTTGKATAVVPAAEVEGTGIVPGSASVTGTCALGAKPVSFGFKQSESGVVVADAFPVGARGLKVVVENHMTDPGSINIAVRCVVGTPGLRLDVQPVIVPVDGSPAIGGSPGDAQGAKACKPGQVLLGGGYRTGDGTFTDGFGPVLLRDVPVLGYLFRNFSTMTENTKLLIFCTPKIIRPAD